MSDLKHWDQVVAPSLHRIESSAVICRERAKHVAAEVNYLAARPEWLTKAKAEMESAKTEMEAALGYIRNALALYEKIPVEGKDGNE